MCDVYGETCFCPKNVYKWANMGLPLHIWVENTLHVVDTDSSVKKKFWAQQSVKKVMLTVFWNIKGPYATDFFEKGTTVNSAYYCFLIVTASHQTGLDTRSFF